MTTYYYDLEAKRADHWLITREEIIAWLDAIFAAPFGPLTLGRFANRTDEAQQARDVANRIMEDAPAITTATDPAAWARDVLRVAAMAGDLDTCAGGSPLVLRFVVDHVKAHARITVADLQGVERERLADKLAAGAYATLRPGIDYDAFGRYLELVQHAVDTGVPLALSPSAIMAIEDKGEIVDLATDAVTWPEDVAK